MSAPLPVLLQAQTAAQSASDNTWGTETWSLTSDDLDLEAVVYEKHTLRWVDRRAFGCVV